jgi:hypothetical protein
VVLALDISPRRLRFLPFAVVDDPYLLTFINALLFRKRTVSSCLLAVVATVLIPILSAVRSKGLAKSQLLLHI